MDARAERKLMELTYKEVQLIRCLEALTELSEHDGYCKEYIDNVRKDLQEIEAPFKRVI